MVSVYSTEMVSVYSTEMVSVYSTDMVSVYSTAVVSVNRTAVARMEVLTAVGLTLICMQKKGAIKFIGAPPIPC